MDMIFYKRFKETFFFLLTGVFLFSAAELKSQNILSNSGFENDLQDWQSWTNDEYSASFAASTSEQYEGSKSLHVNVADVKDEYWAFRYHNIRLRQKGLSLNDGDIIHLSLWAKYAGADAHPMIQAGIARDTLESGIMPEKDPSTIFWDLLDDDMVNFSLTEDWKQYQMELIVTRDAGTDAVFILRFGGMTGDFYVDDIQLEKSGQIEPADPWLDNAQKRIDTLRKANLVLKLEDVNGQAASGANVSAELLRHNFQWGSAVRYVSPFSWDNDDRVWEREEILKTFNTIVNEDDFKWPEVEPTQNNVNYDDVNLYLDWKDTNNLQFRGHCLYWTKEMWMPSWWNNLNTSDKISALKTRCTRDVSYFKGRVPDYDVVNEPVHFPYVEDQVGDSIYRKTFEWAHLADSQAKLYVNDWWNIDKWDSWRLKKWVQTRLSNNTPIHGIGFQGHWDNERVDWREVKFKTDYLADIGLPLKITEFDMHYDQIGMTRVEQAADYGKIMRLVFSHPAYNGFLIWGIRDGWRDNAGIYNDDFSPRPARDTMHYLIKERWTTDTQSISDQEGIVSFNGYYGDYRVIIENGEVSDTMFVNFSDSATSKTLVLADDLVGQNFEIAGEPKQKVKLFPNPCNNELSVLFPDQTAHRLRVVIYNMQGQRMYAYDHVAQNELVLNVDYLPKGQYILSLTEDDEVRNLRFMKR